MSTADSPSTPPRPQRIISSVIIQNTPPRRVWEAITQPEDVAEVIGLLTQNASQTITGQIIDVSMGDKL